MFVRYYVQIVTTLVVFLMQKFVVSIILYKDSKLISATISFLCILNQFSFTALFHSH